MQFVDDVVPHFHRHRLGESTEVVVVKPGGIYTNEPVSYPVADFPSSTCPSLCFAFVVDDFPSSTYPSLCFAFTAAKIFSIASRFFICCSLAAFSRSFAAPLAKVFTLNNQPSAAGRIASYSRIDAFVQQVAVFDQQSALPLPIHVIAGSGLLRIECKSATPNSVQMRSYSFMSAFSIWSQNLIKEKWAVKGPVKNWWRGFSVLLMDSSQGERGSTRAPCGYGTTTLPTELQPTLCGGDVEQVQRGSEEQDLPLSYWQCQGSGKEPAPNMASDIKWTFSPLPSSRQLQLRRELLATVPGVVCDICTPFMTTDVNPQWST
ncbi:hypothetical protein EYF80_016285 [Liparis tanakae]|uniref:Uncharacterized protein n=1 Tax=Liparis tanakae TaxID=230148 RepID=A0A4Z2I7Q4_9TELE|nr:hypothetical protein EYF80_016285 [Liparis tanakae]